MSKLFNNVNSINDMPSISFLEDNLKKFVDYALLEIGSFINVYRPSPDIQGDQGFHKLNYVNDPASQYRVWEAQRQSWVYENEIEYLGNKPININGIYINDTFVPITDTGPYSYDIDYNLGRIVFRHDMNPSLSVEADYSYRHIQTHKSSDSLWFVELQKYSSDSSKFNFFGDYFMTGNHRIQLPCIIIELAPRTILTPYELGSIKNYITQDILFYILAENKSKTINIADLLISQKDNTFNAIDLNKVIKNNVSDLNIFGHKNINRIPYKILSNSIDYIKNQCIIKNTTVIGMSNLSSELYSSTVRWSVEIFP